MGARDKNFYNTIAQKYGYEKEAIEIQDLYLDGQKNEAAAAVPRDFLERANLVGPRVLRQGTARRVEGSRGQCAQRHARRPRSGRNPRHVAGARRRRLICCTAGMRLRQIALVAGELRPVEQQIIKEFGLELCFRDPGIAGFGLRHALFPIGDRLLEVVVPETGRHHGGALSSVGVAATAATWCCCRPTMSTVSRPVSRLPACGSSSWPRASQIKGLHIHPKDVGGAILSIDQADPPESWEWGGFDWEYHSRPDVITDMVAAEIQATDPDAMAERWAVAC